MLRDLEQQAYKYLCCIHGEGEDRKQSPLMLEVKHVQIKMMRRSIGFIA